MYSLCIQRALLGKQLTPYIVSMAEKGSVPLLIFLHKAKAQEDSYRFVELRKIGVRLREIRPLAG
ncbi:hypothetical protein GCM10008915_33660 [Bifidobacterium pullorum subsp. gallinarum]